MCLAVTVLQPGSVYADLEDGTTYILKWQSDITGQYAYEIMYKLRTSADWSTLGINSSTDTSFDLREIYNVTGLDIHELHYRVMVYFKNNELEGKECSSTFSIIFKNKITAYLGTYDGDSISHYPAFDKINSPDIEIMGAGVKSDTKFFPLVDEDSPLNSHLKVRTEKSIKSVASQYAKFRPSNIYGRGEFNKYIQQQYQYTDYVYRNDAYNYSCQYNYTDYNSSAYSYSYADSYSRANYSVGTSPYSYSYSYRYITNYCSGHYYFNDETMQYYYSRYAYNRTYLSYYSYQYRYTYYSSYKPNNYYIVPYYYARQKVNAGYAVTAYYYYYARYSRKYVSSPTRYYYYYLYYTRGSSTYYYTNTKYSYYYTYQAKYSYNRYTYSAYYRYYRYSYPDFAYKYYRAYTKYYYFHNYASAYTYLTYYNNYNYISSYSYLYKYVYGYKPYSYAVTNYGYKYLTGYRNNSYEVPVYGDNSYSYRYYTTNKQEVF